MMKCHMARMKTFYSQPKIMEWFLGTGNQFIYFINKKEKTLGTKHSSPTQSLVPLYSYQQQVFKSHFQFFFDKMESNEAALMTFQRYSSVKLDYFQEEFHFLPNNLDFIQEDLLNLHIFNGQMKFPQLKKSIKLLSIYQRKLQKYNQSLTGNFWNRLWQWFWGKTMSRGQLEGREAWQWVLDLSLPLIQIFVLSLFPWYKVNRVVS
jgi:hypothetical protein